MGVTHADLTVRNPAAPKLDRIVSGRYRPISSRYGRGVNESIALESAGLEVDPQNLSWSRKTGQEVKVYPRP